jgi:hypothetical protein
MDTFHKDGSMSEWVQRDNVRIKTCPICGNEFQTKRYNRKYCDTKCAKDARTRQWAKRERTDGRKAYNRKWREDNRYYHDKLDEPLTQLEKDNLTSVLIQATVADMVRQYREETRWKKKYAEIFLRDYGKIYMNAIGQNVDMDYILNTIDKELGDDIL